MFDEEKYTWYDFKTSDRLFEAVNDLVTKYSSARYSGKLSLVHEATSDPYDLEKSLKALGKRGGTVKIAFLFEN